MDKKYIKLYITLFFSGIILAGVYSLYTHAAAGGVISIAPNTTVRITGVTAPTSGTDAATRAWVGTQAPSPGGPRFAYACYNVGGGNFNSGLFCPAGMLITAYSYYWQSGSTPLCSNFNVGLINNGALPGSGGRPNSQVENPTGGSQWPVGPAGGYYGIMLAICSKTN